MPSSLGEAAVHLAIALFVWRDPGRRQQLGSRATAAFTREQLCQDRRMADESVADRLRGFGVKGILVQMAERGQILELKCEMPQCYHPNGRDMFESLATERRLWAPSRDHYPILRSAGGELRADNVRLSHVECNQRDHTRRKQIGALLLAGESLEDIADTLNRKKTPAFHGTKRWTAAMVREAYVS
jgi:hypothetical protein